MSTITSQQERISENAVNVLRAVQMLGNRYGSQYLIDLLRGTPRFGLRDGSHDKLAIFGSMEGCSPDYLRRLIRLLLRESFLDIVDERFGLIGITSKGEDYLLDPLGALLQPSEMRMPALDRELERRLRKLRQELASKEDKPAFRIFTNFCLEGLVEFKPASIAELLDVPGMGTARSNQYGPAILACIRNLRENEEAFYHQRLLQKAGRPGHQAVKAMFQSGMSVEEMAARRDVKPRTIENIMFTLHRAGEIDLKPWIEQNVSEEELEAGTTWFLNHESRRLRDAYEHVGLDYDTLQLCKLYVSDHRSVATELAKAS